MPALGKAAAALVAAPERRRQMGAAARRHVTERHDMVKVIQQFESLYGELLAAETRTTAWGPRPKQS
jgi:glycosyltransferase involved in cell wall biosynthesis